MIQIILSAALLMMLFYALSQGAKVPVVKFLIGVASIVGIYLVWEPEQANRLAHLVGIGRGADLLLYCWIVISLIVSLNLHLKLKTQMDHITALTRHMAIAEAKKQP